MPSVILAGTTTGTALSLTSDTSGELQIRTNNGSTTAMTLTTGGNINIPTLGARITGDFSTSTLANRVSLQTSTTNGATTVGILPNGTGVISQLQIYNNSDPTNAGRASFFISSTEVRVDSGFSGTGTALPLTMFTNSSERLRIDTSGNVGIGTSSVLSKLNVQSDDGSFASGNLGTFIISGATSSNKRLVLSYNTTADVAYIQSVNHTVAYTPLSLNPEGGNVGIGTSSPTQKLIVAGNIGSASASGTDSYLNVSTNGVQNTYLGFNNSGSTNGNGVLNNYSYVGNGNAYGLQFLANGSVKATIDTSGNLLVGSTNSAGKIFGLQTSNNWAGYFENSNASVTSGVLALIGGRNTTNSSWKAIVYYNSTAAQDRFIVQDSGNVQNINNSYGAISDVKLKENIVDASPKLADLCKVKIRQYNFKSNPEHKQIGVVAQELEEVFSGLVEEQKDQDIKGNDLGTTTKSVKYSVFVPMLIKAVQEQQALIENLTTRLNALEGN
jgi:hypothetical protein